MSLPLPLLGAPASASKQSPPCTRSGTSGEFSSEGGLEGLGLFGNQYGKEVGVRVLPIAPSNLCCGAIMSLPLPLLGAPASASKQSPPRTRSGTSDTHGRLEDSQAWRLGSPRCLVCNGKIEQLSGLICANFGVREHLGRVCKGAWHGRCFRQCPGDPFPVLALQDLDNSLMDVNQCEDDDPQRFEEARDGDHLVTPFQCVDCHFVNIQGRYPDPHSHRDKLAITSITRAIMDSLWSRERSTINSNRLEGLRYVQEMELLGFSEAAYPARGPFPKRDDWGMVAACGVLGRSRAKGKNSSSIQFETARKMRAHLSNFIHTCYGGVGDSYLGGDGHSSIASRSATNSLWFKRFITGCHRRMGDVWAPDRAITAAIMKASFTILEEEWKLYAGDKLGLFNTATLACVLLAGYYGALRGEEIGRVDLGLIAKYWNESQTHEVKHVPLMLAGRFKRVTGEKLFCQPLCYQTKHGMPIGKWFERLLSIYSELGITSGPLFRKGSKRATIGDLDPKMRRLLTKVQTRFPSAIEGNVDLDQFSIQRSLRRGATAEAQNCKIPADIIETNNRWRKHFRSRGLTPGMSMLERYSEARATVPALTQFSFNLRP